MSIVPGLGQLYNGELSKGLMFLAVTGLNATLIVCMAALSPEQVANAVHQQISADALRQLLIAPSMRIGAGIYLVLLASFVAYAMRDAYDQAERSQQGIRYPKFFFGLPEATSTSYIGHIGVTLALIVLVLVFAAPKPAPEQVIEIELEAPPPPPPPPVERPKPQKIQTPKQVAVKPPKPTPRVDKPVVQPPPDLPIVEDAPPAPVAPTSGPSTGTASDTGAGAPGPAPSPQPKDVDYSAYLANMEAKIKKKWFPPRGNESKKVTLRITLNHAGEVKKLRMGLSSGLMIADEAAKSAIDHAAPFGTLPEGAPDPVEISFTFDYDVFNGGKASLR